MKTKVGAVLPDPPSTFTAEITLATELNKLSFRDRQAIEEEIHGVHCGAAEESPELLECSLREFDQQLNARKLGCNVLRNVVRTTSAARGGQALSQPQSGCYLNDRDIRLRFLRSERFVIKKAVQRIIDFLEFMTELFGDYVAERSVRISDFKTRDEQIGLQTSRNQYLPFRDRSGRRVLTGVGTCNFHMNIALRFKILMYLHWVVSEDVETQRKGVVIVAWVFDEANDTTWEHMIRPKMESNLQSYHRRQNNGLPVRVASLQQYYRDTAFFKALSSLYVFGLNSHHRSIYKAHFGGQTELRYKLSSYGVPTDMMPISCTGTVKFTNHSAWLNCLRIKDDQKYSTKPHIEEIVECPRSYDVVFRKGPTYRNNPGNMFYRELIEGNSNEHASRETRKEKYDITLRIINVIEDRNGRFLEWTTKYQLWIIIQDRNKVRTKIAAALKQYKRTRPDKRDIPQLNYAINDAIDICQPRPHDSANDSANESDSEPSQLRRYYRMRDHPLKRQKTSSTLCGTPNHDFDVGDSCFGMGFFMTEDSDLNNGQKTKKP